MHAGPRQSSAKLLAGTLHHATADGPTLGLEEGILHVGFALFQIPQIAGEDFGPVIICARKEKIIQTPNMFTRLARADASDLTTVPESSSASVVWENGC